MKNYKERTEGVLEKVKLKKAKRKKTVMAGVTSFALAALIATNAIWLMPNDYYPLLPPTLQSAYSYLNVYSAIEAYTKAQSNDFTAEDTSSSSNIFVPSFPELGGGSGTGDENFNSYQEVTNNQVEGVIEGDLFKRSDEHIFYLSDSVDDAALLNVYSIDGENSEQITSYKIDSTGGSKIEASFISDIAKIYLSQDAKIATIVLYGFEAEQYRFYTVIINLNVEDIENITELNRVALSGYYVSSRLTEERLLVTTNFGANTSSRFNTKDYIPHTVYGNKTQLLDADSVFIPKKLYSKTYTYLNVLNPKNLQIISDTALLSYTSDVYVSKDNLYVSREYYPYYEEKIEGDHHVVRSRKTDIARLEYDGGELKLKGSVTVDGYIEDQYSMDEKDGVLRVFTSTQACTYSYKQNLTDIIRSASLYCIDIQSFEVFKSVENFAPYGESVRSARFDGNTAYVCTAVQFTDPVFAFDLSDYNNITYTDTGTIEGYSLSLIKFFGDTLLGIGYGDSSTDLKIEVYSQTEKKVESVVKYEKEQTYFSDDFKAYYINAEKGLVGLAIYDYSNNNRVDIENYILYKFDGKNLIEAEICPIEGSYAYSRATLIDDYFYILTQDDFIVINVAEHL